MFDIFPTFYRASFALAANNPFSWIIASGNLSHFQSYLIGLKSRTSHSLCLRQRKLKYHLFSIVHFAKDNLLSENNYPPFFLLLSRPFACFVRLFCSLALFACSLPSEPTILISSCYHIGWFIEGTAIVIIDGLANRIIIYPKDSIHIIFLGR